ncbi:MAG: hypothetical protein ACRDTG_30520 [Pseudonocardiaceae bacterium]
MGVPVSPETIAALFTGLTGLVAALAAYSANRSRRTAADLLRLRRRVRRLELFSTAAVGHIFQLELVLSGNGFPVPARPKTLEQFYVQDGGNSGSWGAEGPRRS